ncbi:MAG: hypothetical protein KHW50_07355 [Clostridium sp.]|nr:hypothetical protein [Clostridium sp.]
MANEQNLIKNEDLTPEQRRKNASKAGKASAKKRQQNKTFKEIINKFLDGRVSDERLKQQMIEFGFADKEVSNKSCAVFALWREAIQGNTKAFELLRDTIGEKPQEKITVNGKINNPFSGLSTEELRKILNE